MFSQRWAYAFSSAFIIVILGLTIQAPQAAETNAPPKVSVTTQGAATTDKPSAKKTEKPLLLLDDEPAAKTGPVSGADNSRCQVCHLNLAKEELAVTHAKANIGCAKCHGASDAHIADESWASGGNGTAPEVMFPKPKINPFCLSCHAREKISLDPHQDLWAGKSEKAYCTDCHGKHRLLNRKCKWK